MRPVFIDCDPGSDDIVALLTAAKLPDLKLVGIGTVCGNVPCDKTYINAVKTVSLIGEDIPVFKGAEAPMMREAVTAEYVHGEDGMCGLSNLIDMPEIVPEKEKAWDALYRLAKEYNGELELVIIGPVTNVAIALAKYKELPSLLKSITIMGGSAAYGNVTPAAEFNIYVDPEAAEILFRCGRTINMLGLDVTEKTTMNPDEIEKLGKLPSKQAKFCYDIMNKAIIFHRSCGVNAVILHDPSAVMYLAYPELFKGMEAGVCVETKAKITRGKTVCDCYVDRKFPFKNANVIIDVDREALVNKLIETIAKY